MYKSHYSPAPLFCRTVIASAICAAATFAQAQGEGSFVLEEVIVTAQKKAENVDDIGATINVVTVESLSNFSVLDFKEIEQFTPGLTLETNFGRDHVISLRGISFSPSSNAASAVDVYWNDIAVHPSVIFQPLFDVARIEILRGPQGVLQGRASPAGAIMVVTQNPDLETMEGYLQSTLSDSGGFNTQFGVSLPLIPDQLGLRIAGIYDENEQGGIRTLATGSIQSERTEGGRATLSWQPSDNLQVKLVSEYTQRDSNPFTAVTGSAPGLPTVDPFDRLALSETNYEASSRTHINGININWEVAQHQVTFLTGYSKSLTDDASDDDWNNTVPDAIQAQSVRVDTEEFNQEIRLSSLDQDVWDYMLGAYYHTSDQDTDYDKTIAVGSDINAATNILLLKDEFGLFSSNTLHFNDSMRLQLGVRWQKIRLTNEAGFVIPAFLPASFASAKLISDDSEFRSFEEITGSIKFLYDMTDTVLVYASIDQGFRPGGVTITGARLTQDLLFFDQELSISAELGAKISMFDNRLQLNAALYWQTFDNYISQQLDVAIDTSPVGSATGPDGSVDGTADHTFNADAEILGAELEFTGLLSENWSLGGAISYNDTQYKDGEEGPCTVFNASNQAVISAGKMIETCDIGGNAIAGQADWSGTLNSEYSLALGSMEGFVRGLYKFTGSRANDDLNVDSRGFGTLNVFVGLRDMLAVWELSVWAKNITNKQAERRLFNPRPNGYRKTSVINERTIGVTGKYYF
jgi:iron complex outermembrane recepter protein